MKFQLVGVPTENENVFGCISSLQDIFHAIEKKKPSYFAIEIPQWTKTKMKVC